MNNLTRRGKIRMISLILWAFFVLGGLSAVKTAESITARSALTASWNHSFGEFSASMEKIDAALQKTIVASGTALQSLSGEISRESALALGALTSLPYSGEELRHTTQFLVQLGDYAAFLSLSGGSIDSDQRQKLAALSGCAKSLNEALKSVSVGISEGSISVGEVLSDEQIGAVTNVIGDSISQIELEFPEYPSLIYDGPFSEHISGALPKYTEGAPQYTNEDAWQQAAELLGLPQEPLYSSEAGGVLPVYSYAVNWGDGSLYVDVTKAGGYLLDLMYAGELPKGTLDLQQLLQIAADFTKKCYGDSMTESYHMRENGILTVNFASSEGEVICYPDLVKVSVASDGSIIGFEARGFLMNHTSRSDISPAISKATAQAAIEPHLTVESSRLAIIPSAGKYERLCYEFLCREIEGGHLLIYVNAETGTQEKVLILLEDENGTLTM